MKKLFALAFLFLILFLNSCAVKRFGIVPLQEGKEPLVDAKTISLPHTFDLLPDLNAMEYDFNYKIELRILDKLKKEFLIVGTDQNNRLREKPIFLFKPETGEVAWKIQSLTPKFTVNFSHQIPDIVIFEGSNKVFAISRQTGEIVWQRTGNYTPLDIPNNLAYSRQHREGKIQMEAFDFTNGLTLWKRGGFKYGWWANDNQILENNIWLASGDGLHTFDLKTGKGWDYKVDTDAIGGMGKVVALHVLSALVGGVTTATPDRYDGLTSNALVIGDKVYYAGNRVLVCVDLDSGKEVWKTKVRKIAAHSVLFEEEDKILMFGLGWCYKNYRRADYSIPYVARFNKSDGKQLLYKPVGTEKRVVNYKITPEGYFFLSDKKLFFIDRINPDTVICSEPTDAEKKKTSIEQFGMPIHIVGNPHEYFIQSGEDIKPFFKNLTEFKTDNTKIWIKTQNGIIQYRNQLEIENWFPNSRINYILAEKDHLKLIRGILQICKDKKEQCKEKEKEYLKLIDMTNNGILLGEIKTNLIPYVLDESILLWGDKKLIVQSLDSIYSAYK